MKKALIWLVVAAVFIGTIAGASVLYKNLSEGYDGNDLIVNDGGQKENENKPSEDKGNANIGGNETDKPGGSAGEAVPPVKLNVPDFTVLDYDGNEVKLSDYAGKPIVLNFWATWCYYCMEEMPDFDKAYENYPDVQFFMVNATDGYHETVSKAKEYIESEKYKFDVFFDTEEEAVKAYNITGFPTTFFIGTDGNLVATRRGMLDYEILEKGIKMITE